MPLPGEPKLTDLAHLEWLTWLAVGEQLKLRGIDIEAPEHEVLVRVIRDYAVRFCEVYRDTGRFHPEYAEDRRVGCELIAGLPRRKGE